MPIRRIVCLANSKKLNAYCVAGVDPETLEWIRPLGSGSHGAVTLSEQTFPDGTRPELLDIIEVPLDTAMPQAGHPENWLLGRDAWRRVGRLDDQAARRLLDDLIVEDPVFGTNGRSVSVDEVAAGHVETSLAVIRPENIRWRKEVWPERTKVKALFAHANAHHNLPVTDLAWKQEFAEDDPGDYGHNENEQVFLVVSLAEPLDGIHYKLVAGVICL